MATGSGDAAPRFAGDTSGLLYMTRLVAQLKWESMKSFPSIDSPKRDSFHLALPARNANGTNRSHIHAT